MKTRCAISLLLASGYLVLLVDMTGAADIKILSANVFTDVLDEHFRAFERASGNKVVFEYATAGKVRDRLLSGEQADVAIVTRPMADELEGSGKIVRGTTATIARSAVALVVKKGANKPDITSTDAFKRALRSAQSISYPDPARGGATGVLFVRDLDRLGLTDEIKSKTVFPKPGHIAVELVANGEAEMAIAQPMEALLQPGVDIVGLLPSELQSPASFTFAAGEISSGRERAAAQALIEYLGSVPVQLALKKKGMEPAK